MPAAFGIQVGIQNRKRAYFYLSASLLHLLGLGASACRRQNRHRLKSDYIFLYDLHRLHLVTVHPQFEGEYLATPATFATSCVFSSFTFATRQVFSGSLRGWLLGCCIAGAYKMGKPLQALALLGMAICLTKQQPTYKKTHK
ncbi:hypothetical protein [Thiopseudomonas alkaliphila]|uniref:hypothetical protein n=1 Tax=Thiopseudomonas alkaliphila TaxID=1697053 RepID=UPI002575EC9B|nr:hypothetical protein [Thiopseudomonas alkaliphila]MDM1707704.1 hypothetical protein [Thiopseudomonas alkaliphila]